LLTEREEILAKVRDLIANELGGYDAQIYLFGSWAKCKERRTSDIDIAIQHDGRISPYIFTQIRFLLEESTIPYRVDVVNLRTAGSVLAEKVKKEGILWKDCLNVSK